MTATWQFFQNNYGVLGFFFTVLFAAGHFIYKIAEAKPEDHAKVRGWIYQAVDWFAIYVLPLFIIAFSLLVIWAFVTKDGPITRDQIFSVATMVAILITTFSFTPSQQTIRRRDKYHEERHAQHDQSIKELRETIDRLNKRLDQITESKRTRI